MITDFCNIIETCPTGKFLLKKLIRYGKGMVLFYTTKGIWFRYRWQYTEHIVYTDTLYFDVNKIFISHDALKIF